MNGWKTLCFYYLDMISENCYLKAFTKFLLLFIYLFILGKMCLNVAATPVNCSAGQFSPEGDSICRVSSVLWNKTLFFEFPLFEYSKLYNL